MGGVQQAAMGRHVGGGMTWMAVTAILTRITAFLAQILLGKWLDAPDFALYATATAIAGFMMVCRDMATGYIIVQRGREGYEQSAGPGFWLGFTYNMVVLGVVGVCAYPLARGYYNDEQLAPMLLVMAATLPFGAVANVLYSRLRLDLKFRELSWAMTASGFSRQISMIVFAKLGFGPMSFAWPMLVAIMVDCLVCLYYTRDFVWMRGPKISEWWSWAKEAVWLMFTSLANFAMDFGPYLVLGPILGASSKITGYYFFAYQITAQVGIILAFNATIVLTPALQKLNDEPVRQREAALRALKTLMLAGCMASLGLAAVFGPLEDFLWHGKYAESVAAVAIFGAFYPWRISFGLTTSLLTAQGRYKQMAILSTIECVGLMIVSGIAGYVSPTATGIAWWTGAWVLASRVGATMYVFGQMGASPWAVTRAMFPAWVVCVVAAGGAWWLAHATGFGGWVRGALGVPDGAYEAMSSQDQLMQRVSDLVEITVYGSLSGIAMLVLARCLLADDLRDAVAVMPGRIQGLARRALRLETVRATDG